MITVHEQAAGITLISVGHRPSIIEYHDNNLILQRGGKWTLQKIAPATTAVDKARKGGGSEFSEDELAEIEDAKQAKMAAEDKQPEPSPYGWLVFQRFWRLVITSWL